MKLALYQPEIPQNVGTILRLGACMGIAIHIIEPCGFIMSDRRLRRSGMDYLDTATMIRHTSWSSFYSDRVIYERLVLLTPHTDVNYTDFEFSHHDILVVGQESCGVPDDVKHVMDACVRIPMRPHHRSLNVAIAAAMVVGEALRQTQTLPSFSSL